MKKPLSARNFMLPYNFGSYFLTAFSFAASLCFLIVFIAIVDKIPDKVPTHWTAGVGIDGWGRKSELYPLGIIPMVFAVVALPLSIFFIRKEYQGISYFINGISLFVLLMCILAASVLLSSV